MSKNKLEYWEEDPADKTLFFSKEVLSIKNSLGIIFKCTHCKKCTDFKINSINKNLFKCAECNSLIRTGPE